MKLILALSLSLFGAHAFADDGIQFDCQNKHESKMQISVSNPEADVKNWEITGQDTNPFDCNFRKISPQGPVFSCSSYQGAPYGYLVIPATLQKSIRVQFLYVDENDGHFSGKFVGTCNQK